MARESHHGSGVNTNLDTAKLAALAARTAYRASDSRLRMAVTVMYETAKYRDERTTLAEIEVARLTQEKAAAKIVYDASVKAVRDAMRTP